MFTPVNYHQFVQAFRNMGRANQFSSEGLAGLFDYIVQYEEDTGEEIELDVIALCCDYSEASWRQVASDYGINVSDCDGDNELHEKVNDFLCYNTSVIWSDEDGVIYANF